MNYSGLNAANDEQILITYKDLELDEDAINPTIPASPKDCTKPVMFDAISPTNGTFPPSKLNTIPKASNDITTFVRLSKIDVSPAIAFMFSLFYFY